ncbi:hypothetical protein RIKO2308_149c00010 [Escherichia coli]|nr:hypothetical protein RIKO2340_123c00010 [Escherichia coli]OAC28144.1 hypothetical protein RIKO2308_149c00010 [Escherichia coli]
MATASATTSSKQSNSRQSRTKCNPAPDNPVTDTFSQCATLSCSKILQYRTILGQDSFSNLTIFTYNIKHGCTLCFTRLAFFPESLNPDFCIIFLFTQN